MRIPAAWYVSSLRKCLNKVRQKTVISSHAHARSFARHSRPRAVPDNYFGQNMVGQLSATDIILPINVISYIAASGMGPPHLWGVGGWSGLFGREWGVGCLMGAWVEHYYYFFRWDNFRIAESSIEARVSRIYHRKQIAREFI